MNNLQARLSARGSFFTPRALNAALVAALLPTEKAVDIPIGLNVVRTVATKSIAMSQSATTRPSVK